MARLRSTISEPALFVLSGIVEGLCFPVDLTGSAWVMFRKEEFEQ